LKIRRFLVLRLAFENSSSIESRLDDSSSVSSTNSTTEERFPGPGAQNGPLLRLETLVNRFLIRGSRSPFEWMLDLRSYGLKIARNTTSSGYINWEGETIIYRTLSFSIANFREFVHGLISSTRALLFQDILFENSISTAKSPLRKIPDISWRQIYDNPLDSTPFSNFLNDSRTNIGLENPERFLYSRIATSPDLASRFTIPGPEFHWDSRELSDWISFLSRFLENLLVLIHVTGGQPARAPELLSLRYSNSTKTGTRNIFIENGLLVFVTSYYKGYSISGTTKIIHRYLPREVGELLVYYLWLVVPFLERILLTNFRKTLPEYLFKNLLKSRRSKATRINSERFRKVFRRETLAGLGLAVNPSDYRHIAIGISRRFLSKSLQFQPEESTEIEDENDVDYEDDVLDL